MEEEMEQKMMVKNMKKKWEKGGGRRKKTKTHIRAGEGNKMEGKKAKGN